MFKAPNPYEEGVAKATDEGLTCENWQLNLDLCDKLSDGNEANARLMLAAIQRRLAHKNTNVQLYALTLTDMLSKNCGNAVHHEIASRSFMQTLSRLCSDRSTHRLTKKRILSLLRAWAEAYQADDTLSLVAETMRDLRSEYYDMDDDEEGSSNAEAAELLRREEEELQRVLALSVQDQGGRAPYDRAADAESSAYAPSASTSAMGAASSASAGPSAPRAPSDAATAGSSAAAAPRAPDAGIEAAPVAVPAPAEPARPAFVRALYDFEPDEPGELAFSAGDVIRVLDGVYEQWWRGELRHEVGIFPVNYVEPVPAAPPDAGAQDWEMEQRVFAQAADIHLLHARLQQLDPLRDNFVDDDELQELYQRSLALRPKIIRLMDRYSGKVQDLRAMNDKFMRARSMFEELIAQRMEQYTAPNDAAAHPAAADAARSAASAVPRAPSAPSAPAAVAASAPELGSAPNEEEKRRLFERAKAEVAAYHQTYHGAPPDAAHSLAGLQLE